MRIQWLAKAEVKEGKLVISGAMSPIMAASYAEKELRKEGFVKAPLTVVGRVWWDSDSTLQINEGTPTKPEVTGMDTLILVFEHTNERQFCLIQDQGHQMMPIGMFFETEKEMTYTSIYEKEQRYIRKPDVKEIIDLMSKAVQFPRQAERLKKELENYQAQQKSE